MLQVRNEFHPEELSFPAKYFVVGREIKPEYARHLHYVQDWDS